MRNSISELRQAVGSLFSQKPTHTVSHGAVAGEVKDVAKIAGHGAKGVAKVARKIGRKIKRTHQVGQARRAVKRKMATQGMQQVNASIKQSSNILNEVVQKIKGIKQKVQTGVRRHQAYRVVMKKHIAKKLQKMDAQRTRIKKEKGVYKKIIRGKHQGEIIPYAA